MGQKQQLLIADLEENGYHFSDINHLFKQSNLLPVEVSNIILKWLPDIYREHIGAGECLVRALISAGEPYDPYILIDLFENSDLNDTLKCTIGFVLSISNTLDIKQWLKNELLTKEHSFARAGLLSGIIPKGQFQTKEEVKDFLFKIFDKYSYYEKFQILVQKCSTIDDIAFIEQKAIQADTKRKSRELFRVADKIRTRKRTPAFP